MTTPNPRKVVKMLSLAPLLLLWSLPSIHGNILSAERETRVKEKPSLRRNSLQTSHRGLEGNIFNSDTHLDTHIDDQVIQTQATTCQLSPSGFYGTIVGTPKTVTFLYQATIASGTSQAAVKTDILTTLDRLIVFGLLPYFFDCNGRRRRQLQTNGASSDGTITAISTQEMDTISEANDIPCASTVAGDCYTFQGSVIVFGTDIETETEATNLVLPAVKLYLQSLQNGALTGIDSRLLDLRYVVRNGGGTMMTIGPLPTPSPVTQSPVAPTPVPVSPPPSRLGTTPSPVATPTLSPTGNPGSTPAPVSTTETPAPVETTTETPAPVGSTTETPAPVGSTTVTQNPTSEPLGTPKDPTTPSPVGTKTAQADEESGLDKMEWWMWLLVGIGGFTLLLCGLTYMSSCGSGGGGGAPRPKKQRSTPEQPPFGGTSGIAVGGTVGADDHDDDDDDAYQPPSADVYQPPSADTYVPPGMGATPFTAPTTTTTAAPPVNMNPIATGNLGTVGEDEEYDEGQDEYDEGQDEYDDGHDDDDDDYDDVDDEYDDGQDEDDYEDEDEYDDEEGEEEYEGGEEEYEEEEGTFSEYDEETIDQSTDGHEMDYGQPPRRSWGGSGGGGGSY